MANATVSHLGQINASGAEDALFLKIFAGEVLTSFEQSQVMMDKHYVRTISHGKSASFPVMGRASASYHTAGDEILGGKLKHNERVITIDEILLSSSFIANIDEAKNHYDVRSVYSAEQGRALANNMDKHILQTGVLAARSARLIDDADQYGGTTIYNVSSTDGDALADAVVAAAQTLDEKDVPQEGRCLFVRPEQYYQLIKSDKTLNRDYGGKGSYADGKVFCVAGIDIYMTNNLPSTNVASGSVEAGTDDKYAGDFSNTIGLVMHSSAIGTVKLLDLGMEAEYQVSRQGTLLVAKYAVGHGILRGEAAVELSTAVA